MGEDSEGSVGLTHGWGWEGLEKKHSERMNERLTAEFSLRLANIKVQLTISYLHELNLALKFLSIPLDSTINHVSGEWPQSPLLLLPLSPCIFFKPSKKPLN